MEKLTYKLTYLVTVIIVVVLLAFSVYQVYQSGYLIISCLMHKKIAWTELGRCILFIWSTYGIYIFLVGMHMAYLNDVYSKDIENQRKQSKAQYQQNKPPGK